MTSRGAQPLSLGRLDRDEERQSFTGEVRWTDDTVIEIAIRGGQGPHGRECEWALQVLRSVQALEPAFRSLAATEVLDSFNETVHENGEGESVDRCSASALAEQMTLVGIEIDAAGGVELSYSTDGGPLVRLSLSPNLTFAGALLD